MSEERFDIVVFGATGFTGQYVAEELARIAEEERITWAVAGRNINKLKGILNCIKEETGNNMDAVGVIIADIENAVSLNEMARKARVVLNCVGPYKFFGEDVIKACILNGASHIDISGEPKFHGQVHLNYNSKARESKVYIVGACGYDSIPSEMGTVFLENEFQGQVSILEAYYKLHASKGYHFHYGTWWSAIYIVSDLIKEFRTSRENLFPQWLTKIKPQPSFKSVHYSQIVRSWCLPFLGPDQLVMHKTQHYFFSKENKRPVPVSAYIQCTSLFHVLLMAVGCIIFLLMDSCSMGRKLLKKYPEVFSAGIFDRKGPSKQQMKETSFSLTLAGCGWAEKLVEPTDNYTGSPTGRIVVRVSGPEPGYVATPICMVQAGLVIIRETENLPTGGGVYSPGAAFAKTTIIQRLKKRGIQFENITSVHD